MDWSPFVVCGVDDFPPASRGLGGPHGLGDRLRTAAFAERQAFAAFQWAAQTIGDASQEMRSAWRQMASEEEGHLQLILGRMAELGVSVSERPVSDRLWRWLRTSHGAKEFSVRMLEAEARGKAAEDSFRRSLSERDPVTAAIFARIADDEARHLALGERFAGR